MKKIFYFLSILFLLLNLKLNCKEKQTNSPLVLHNEEFIETVQDIFPNCKINLVDSLSYRFADISYDSTAYYALSTADYTSIKGYKGYSNFMIILNQSLEVDKIIFLESEDTKPYVMKILNSDILSKLSNQNLNTEKRPIHLVSGATITSRVFCKSINLTLDSFKKIIDRLEKRETEISDNDTF